MKNSHIFICNGKFWNIKNYFQLFFLTKGYSNTSTGFIGEKNKISNLDSSVKLYLINLIAVDIMDKSNELEKKKQSYFHMQW
jgi:hypothetical protein